MGCSSDMCIIVLLCSNPLALLHWPIVSSQLPHFLAVCFPSPHPWATLSISCFPCEGVLLRSFRLLAWFILYRPADRLSLSSCTSSPMRIFAGMTAVCLDCQWIVLPVFYAECHISSRSFCVAFLPLVISFSVPAPRFSLITLWPLYHFTHFMNYSLFANPYFFFNAS